MKFLKLFTFKNKKPVRKVADFYQAQIEKAGRDQIQKIVDRGLSLPVFLM